jgi:hypothetical protein
MGGHTFITLKDNVFFLKATNYPHPRAHTLTHTHTSTPAHTNHTNLMPAKLPRWCWRIFGKERKK